MVEIEQGNHPPFLVYGDTPVRQSTTDRIARSAVMLGEENIVGKDYRMVIIPGMTADNPTKQQNTVCGPFSPKLKRKLGLGQQAC